MDKNIRNLVFFISLVLPSILAFNSTSMIEGLKNPSVAFDTIAAEISEGSMNGFVTLEEGYGYIYKCMEEFPNLIFNRTIGNTYEGQDIVIFGLTNLQKNQDNLETMPSMIFTGMHHAREPLSYMMNLYLISHLIYNSVRNDTKINKVLNQSLIWFIPALNLDGYRKIIEIFQNEKRLDDSIRKNRRPNSLCQDHNIGVDLNRNYEFEFGHDNEGSSAYVCAEDYRGPNAFSEPETQAIRDFGLKYKKNLKLAINFHAYGNLWITPFNYLNDKTNLNLAKMKKVYKFYEDFHNNATFSPTHKFGNAAKTINYVANGEASDWFLGKLGVFSISPELGDDRQSSNEFYPPKSEILPILQNCFPPIDYLLKKMSFNTQVISSKQTNNEQLLTLTTTEKTEKTEFMVIEIQLFNEAMIDQEIKEIKLSLKSSHNQNLPLKIRGILYTVTNEDQETAANESIFGDSTLNFLGRSYLNLSVLISQKDVKEIQENYSLQDLLVIKLNDHREILVKDVGYLNLKLDKNEEGNGWAWFLVSFSFILIALILILIGVIVAKRKRNFFEKLKITGDNEKGENTLSDRNKVYTNFNREYEI